MKYIIKESQLYNFAKILIEQQIDDEVPEQDYEMPDLTKVDYQDLNVRQKESYNFQKLSAILADYGYFPIRLSDDWEGADFICIKCTTKKFLKVQLKGAFTIDKKYLGKNLYLSFFHRPSGQWYLYPHDYVANRYLQEKNISNTTSWQTKGKWWNERLTKYEKELLEPFKL